MSTEGQRLVLVGRVGRPHGTDGSFVVEGASGDPARFAVGATVLAGGEPARVVSVRRVGKGRLAVRLDRTVERGTELAVPRDTLPPPAEGSYYVADLVGLEVVEEGRGRVGVVSDVLSLPANDVLELDTGLLLPLVEDCVREVDLERGRVVLNPGFID
ncbi:MAG TPA: ribosome maturation factor RimM [Gaiellaceae bacterium]|nr:ribosome maturation factor RimM [Gaiellaceae bacterium]